MNRTGTTTGGHWRATCGRAPQGSAFSEFYLRFFAHHLRAIAKSGRLVRGHDGDAPAVARPGAAVRMVVYRRTPNAPSFRRGQSPEQALATICDRLVGGLANAGVKGPPDDAADIHDWLLRWFNPHPTLGSDRRGPGTLLRADPLSRGGGGRRDRTGQRRLRAAAVLRPAALGRGQRHLAVRRPAASGHRHGPFAHAAPRRAISPARRARAATRSTRCSTRCRKKR